MEFSIVNVKAKQAITIRAHTTAEDVGNKFAEIFRELESIMKKQSLNFAGAHFGIYHNYSPDDFDLEAGIPVTGNPVQEGRMNVMQTYGGKAVMAKFYDDSLKLDDAWDEMIKFIKVNNLKISAPRFEVYITDPKVYTDPEKLMAEIYYPVI